MKIEKNWKNIFFQKYQNGSLSPLLTFWCFWKKNIFSIFFRFFSIFMIFGRLRWKAILSFLAHSITKSGPNPIDSTLFGIMGIRRYICSFSRKFHTPPEVAEAHEAVEGSYTISRKLLFARTNGYWNENTHRRDPKTLKTFLNKFFYQLRNPYVRKTP